MLFLICGVVLAIPVSAGSMERGCIAVHKLLPLMPLFLLFTQHQDMALQQNGPLHSVCHEALEMHSSQSVAGC